jgi:hypothetical protein
MSRDKQQIGLNFLSLSVQDFSLSIYKAVASPSAEEISMSEDAEVRRYRLPVNSTGTEYGDFNISLQHRKDFTKDSIDARTNFYLTQYALYRRLCRKCETSLEVSEYFIETKFRNMVSIVLADTSIGHETVWLEPYYLHKTREFGFLVGYHFRLKDGHAFDRSVLQKSLSLGSDGRENKDYYVDHYRKIVHFLEAFHSRIFPLEIEDGTSATVRWPPNQIPAKLLDTKTYVFANGKTESSQFQGIRKHGPLQAIQDNSLICFVYRPQDKPLSYELYHALRGERYATFPGMKSMFSFSLGKEHVTGLALQGYDHEDVIKAADQIAVASEDRPCLPLILFPWSRTEHDPEGMDCYYKIKHQFLGRRLPTQFVTIARVRGREGLKWSISNIGLAVFSKLGGKPWKLTTKQEKCLIIGIGQAHRKDQAGISRYFAYSVLSDSSGLYDSIRILSKSEDQAEYLNGLTKRIKAVIEEFSDSYTRFVIHTPFKLRRYEMDAIKMALEELPSETDSERSFTVLKFNENSKFFAFALNSNSKVPYESSCLSLGKKQYLVWFEGLQYHNPTIRRRIARPMHVEFMYSNRELSHEDEKDYLQDAINLSGANWRGFNAKTLPVSVYYAKLIAEYISHFDRLGLPEIDIENLPPWFL